MGIFGKRIREHYAADEDTRAAAFAVDADSIDPAVFGLTSYASSTAPAPRIDRRSAIQVPAVKRTRDLIAGSLGGTPLVQYDRQRRRVESQLLAQPERNVPRSVTMTRLVEDLLFESTAWWFVIDTVATWPVYVERVLPGNVREQKDGLYVTRKIAGEWTTKKAQPGDLIRFDSPNDPLLVAGARAIRTCLLLDAAAARYADEPLPLSYFTPEEGQDPDETEVTEALDAWATARRARATGYVPAALKLNTPAGFSPEQLQLADSRQHAVLEIARVGGVDPEDLGVSTTTRTYANQFDRRKWFTDFTLGGYINAIQDRLGMPDVTPRGNYVRFAFDEFGIADPAARFAAYEVGKRVGALDQDDIDRMENRPSGTVPANATPPPVTPTAPTQEITR